MDCWVIYDHPKDYPSCYVARRWEMKLGENVPTNEAYLSSSIETLREVVGHGRVRFARAADDDPVIVETWL